MNVGMSWQLTGSSKVVRFRVAARVRWGWAGWPFGRLTADRNRLVVSGPWPSKAVLERGHVKAIYVRWRFLRRAIAFDTDDRSSWWVYVYSRFRRGRILAALGELGWPVR